MERKPIREDTAYVYCSRETKKRAQLLKRGGGTYDSLFQRLADRYDPDPQPAAGGPEVTDGDC